MSTPAEKLTKVYAAIDSIIDLEKDFSLSNEMRIVLSQLRAMASELQEEVDPFHNEQ